MGTGATNVVSVPADTAPLCSPWTTAWLGLEVFLREQRNSRGQSGRGQRVLGRSRAERTENLPARTLHSRCRQTVVMQGTRPKHQQ